ncbi:GAP family protein [Candidatus Mycobacterium methanotrophicum]|uniref:GAP family protein n=1 Tax=Candidatus Mycobacterium methanotrophicum TaxID=2943498 RepID=A0ABY4QHY4_9MYCO|nr:GAP family protein [Candidatus Mycobacterium methanotrophicum]UQX09953.1 GAP family protein [Candidatus Mycobacterium methanotrophicum]
MWSSLLALAIPIALDPVRLGLNLLLVSRPRPARDLLVYWVGCALVGFFLLLIPILVLHFTPSLSSFVHDLANPATAASAGVRYLEIVAGVVVLSVAAFLTVGFFGRQRARLATRGASTSTLVLDSDAPNLCVIRRLVGRANTAWESESSWVALAMGFWAGPNPAMVVFGLTTVLTSGAPLGVQAGAAIVFIVETLAVVEIVLLGNLIAPAKTQALLRRLHDWARSYRRQILVAMLGLVGLALVAQGIGAI